MIQPFRINKSFLFLITMSQSRLNIVYNEKIILYINLNLK